MSTEAFEWDSDHYETEFKSKFSGLLGRLACAKVAAEGRKLVTAQDMMAVQEQAFKEVVADMASWPKTKPRESYWAWTDV